MTVQPPGSAKPKPYTLSDSQKIFLAKQAKKIIAGYCKDSGLTGVKVRTSSNGSEIIVNIPESYSDPKNILKSLEGEIVGPGKVFCSGSFEPTGRPGEYKFVLPNQTTHKNTGPTAYDSAGPTGYNNIPPSHY